jgi:hypothetical protein
MRFRRWLIFLLRPLTRWPKQYSSNARPKIADSKMTLTPTKQARSGIAWVPPGADWKRHWAICKLAPIVVSRSLVQAMQPGAHALPCGQNEHSMPQHTVHPMHSPEQSSNRHSLRGRLTSLQVDHGQSPPAIMPHPVPQCRCQVTLKWVVTARGMDADCNPVDPAGSRA